MYDKSYFCLDQLPKLKKESTASFFVNFGGAGVQKSRPTLLYAHFVIFDIFVQVQETKNNLYLVEVTNNGRTTEGEYRVALPDGRVQVEI